MVNAFVNTLARLMRLITLCASSLLLSDPIYPILFTAAKSGDILNHEDRRLRNLQTKDPFLKEYTQFTNPIYKGSFKICASYPDDNTLAQATIALGQYSWG